MFVKIKLNINICKSKNKNMPEDHERKMANFFFLPRYLFGCDLVHLNVEAFLSLLVDEEDVRQPNLR